MTEKKRVFTENTMKTYNSALSGLSDDVFDSEPITKSLLNNTDNINKIFGYLDGTLNIKRQWTHGKRRPYKLGTPLSLVSQKTILQAIRAITDDYLGLKASINRMLTKRLEHVLKEYMKERENEKENPKQKDIDKIIDLDQMKDLKEKLRADINETYQPLKDVSYIIISLYTDLSAPCRPQDFYNTIVVDSSDDLKAKEMTMNYLLLDEGLIHINNGKTKNSIRTIAIPEDLLNDIKEFHKKSGSKWLIPSTQDKTEHMQQCAFTRLLQRTFTKYFGKPVSASMLRKIHVSKVYKEIDEQVPEFKNIMLKLKDIAKAMGHTMTTQEIYARLKKDV